MSLADVRAALNAELSATPEFYDFKVQQAEREGSLWRVTLEPDYVFAEGQRPGLSPQALLDESLDGAAAWWGAPVRGGARVLAVLAEDDQLLLHNASSAPPPPGQLIRLYPTRFLNAVADAWWDTPWAEQALACLGDLGNPQPLPPAEALTGEPFRWLRPRQRQALGLVGHSSGFLWGPPGTGKTTTLGVLVAEYLARRPAARVLLLSTTHQAVDQATLAVDKALEKGRREALRRTVQRLGTRFQAGAYTGREHLLPTQDTALIARLARAEASRPSARDAAALKAWADRVAALRDELRSASLQVLRNCRLACMTTTRAAFTVKTLRQLAPNGQAPFDLVVFDEASQVSLAHALALIPLGRARLFAGDPQQLAPVLRSDDRLARRWLGRSAFDEMPRTGPALALLDEQSRMAPPIGELVSELFYGGSLRVAGDALGSAAWRADRQRALGPIGADRHVHLHRVKSDGAWVAAARGPVRRESAEALAELVAQALAHDHWRPEDLIVLTPFRAQRALIRQRLQARGLPETLRVSTVHRAQGSEAPVVLFDPADASQPFLHGEAAQRLLNVAMSRAQAKLVLFVSPADAASPLLSPLMQRLRLAGDARPATPLLQLARQRDFPANALGQRVSAGRHEGEVVRVSPDGAQLWLVNARTGAQQLIDAEFWRRRAREAASAP